MLCIFFKKKYIYSLINVYFFIYYVLNNVCIVMGEGGVFKLVCLFFLILLFKYFIY